MTTLPNERTALFIDAGYLDKLVQHEFAEQSGGRKVPLPLDLKKLPALLAGEKPWRVFYYYAMPWVSDPPLPAEHAVFQGKERFMAFLGRLKGWELRQGVVERRTSGKDVWFVQKRIDVMLAVDLVRLAWKGEIQQAVILAGDSDFVPAVEDARAAGVRVTIRYAPGTAHEDLVRACDQARSLSREELQTIRLPN
jgi:uncharacterized LabA/DUF88 family protein